MSQNAVVRARIDADIKSEAAAVLADMGLTVSDVCRIVLTRVAKEKELPFELLHPKTPHVPNAATEAAMEATKRGEGTHYATVDALFDDLGV